MAGIYIHIPFCKQRCTYCDFHFSTAFSRYRTEMIRSIAKELENRNKELADQTVQTIYFGGGTPSILEKNELELLLQTVYANYSVAENAEITLECNPDDMTDQFLEHWKIAGINRLSIGLQSFRESDLRWMNRAHTAEQALSCIPRAQKYGFQNMSIDLIYGLPGLSEADWNRHIETVLSFGIQHISAYCLTVEKRTALQKMVSVRKLVLPNEDEQGSQFLQLIAHLQANGFEQYEISNFALAGFEAKHNSAYWKGTPYLGAGPSAHSFDGISRRWNIANNELYLRKLQHGEIYWESERLSAKERFNELVMTGLRTSKGVHLPELVQIHLPDAHFTDSVSRFIAEKWMIQNEGQLVLTSEGKLQADYIASSLFLID